MEELDVIKTQALQATWIKVQSSILRCVIVALILLCVYCVLLVSLCSGVWCVVLMEELDVIKTQALQATWIKVQSSILRCVIVALILLCVAM
jgi:deoxycytidine triphosphate deaminase